MGLLLSAGAVWLSLPRGEARARSLLAMSGAPVPRIRLAHVSLRELAPSPDRRYAALLTDRKLFVLARDGRVLAETTLSAARRGVAWSPTAGKIYASLASGRVAYFEWDGHGLRKLGELAPEAEGTPGQPGTGALAVGRDGTVYAALAFRRQVVGIGPRGEEKMRQTFLAIPDRIEVAPSGNTLAITLLASRKKPSQVLLDPTGRLLSPPSSSQTAISSTQVRLQDATLSVEPAADRPESLLVAVLEKR